MSFETSESDGPDPYVVPGFSLHTELEWLVKSGFSPMQALQSATFNPALFLATTSPNSEEQRNEKTPLLDKDARNGGSDQMDRKPKQPECHPVLLETCHSLQASIFGQPACIAEAGKGSVLIDSKNADGAGT
jgi:hypothetical protein